ncbi:RNA polymerase sigma factor [Rubneribacter badeniensis]|uniref:RNA polymerase sigma factor n=1 Tax=Rubneribacter badeniensis TaxID=2070688 RepID=UPI003A951F2C
MPRKTPDVANDHDRSEALARAMRDWGDAVYRLALGQTRSRADAEDVYQDVFLRLYNRTDPFSSGEHQKAWLLRVTVNRCHDLARSSWKRRTVELDPERDAPLANADGAPDASGALDGEDAAVWEAVGELPENLRAAVHLHYVEGYSTDEIARILNSQPATVRTWLHRARTRMRELLSTASTSPHTTYECPNAHTRASSSPSAADENTRAKRPGAGAPPAVPSIARETPSR